jgi:hypothetical protein
MGPDRKKRFLDKNPELAPAGEEILGVLVAEPKGGAWRRGIRQASPVGDALMSLKKGEQAPGAEEGDVGAWPDSRFLWLVLTDKQLHVFEGRVGSPKAGPAAAHYPLERIADMSLDKKLLISKLNVTFKDGGSVVLDISKQKVQDFIDAIPARP